MSGEASASGDGTDRGQVEDSKCARELACYEIIDSNLDSSGIDLEGSPIRRTLRTDFATFESVEREVSPPT